MNEEQIKKDYPTYEEVIKLVMKLEIELKELYNDMEDQIISLRERLEDE